MFSGIERVGPLTDKQIGPYVVGEMLGIGTFSAVYRAQHLPLRSERALKILRPDFNGSPDIVQQFAYEARIMAALKHPNIVTLFDVDSEFASQEDPNYYHYMAMELVSGKPISEVFKDRKPTPDLALSLIGQIGSALDYAHQKGIIHNDLKPSNILLGRDFQIKVTDFGSARNLRWTALNRHQLTATASYSAPELLRGEDPTIKSDIYSLGTMSYELLTGQTPVARPDSNRQTLENSLRQSGIKLSPRLQTELMDVLLQQMSADSFERPESLAGFLELLNRAGDSLVPGPGKFGEPISYRELEINPVANAQVIVDPEIVIESPKYLARRLRLLQRRGVLGSLALVALLAFATYLAWPAQEKIEKVDGDPTATVILIESTFTSVPSTSTPTNIPIPPTAVPKPPEAPTPVPKKPLGPLLRIDTFTC